MLSSAYLNIVFSYPDHFYFVIYSKVQYYKQLEEQLFMGTVVRKAYLLSECVDYY